jgi:hypothetical protein
MAEKGLLDFIPDGMAAMRAFAEHLENVTRKNQELGKRLARHTRRMQAVADDPAKKRMRAADAAREIDRFSVVLEQRLPMLRASAALFGESYINYFEAVRDEEIESGRSKITVFRQQVQQLTSSSRESRLGGLTGFRESIADLRRMKLSQALNQSTDRLLPAMDAVLAMMTDVEQSNQRLLIVMNRRLAVTRKSTSRKARPQPQSTP